MQISIVRRHATARRAHHESLLDQVRFDDILDGAVTSADVADGAITGVDVADGTITGGDIADGSITSSDITDGTSNTLLVGEKTGLQGTSNPRCRWCETNAIFYSFLDSNPPSNEVSVALGTTRIGLNSTNERGFHSFHTGGVQFVMCDGSVKFISENIATNVRRAIATRAGGETLQVP